MLAGFGRTNQPARGAGLQAKRDRMSGNSRWLSSEPFVA
jgi:hypothetical protein